MLGVAALAAAQPKPDTGVLQSLTGAQKPEAVPRGPRATLVLDPEAGVAELREGQTRATPLPLGQLMRRAAWVRHRPELVPIPAGTFTMGSPDSEQGPFGDKGPQHKVTLTRRFFMQRTEVTQAQWQALMGNNPSKFLECGPSCPVENVTWFEAAAYANALSTKRGLPPCYTLSGCDKKAGEGMTCKKVTANGVTCRGYRLPTETEWEYAARAGTTTRFWSGDTEAGLTRVGWYHQNSGGKTHRVGLKPANPWGLHDVHGNVWEWCSDFYDPKAYRKSSRIDPEVDEDQAPEMKLVYRDGDDIKSEKGKARVVRGGSWRNDASVLRAAHRHSGHPALRLAYLGFRVVLRPLP